MPIIFFLLLILSGSHYALAETTNTKPQSDFGPFLREFQKCCEINWHPPISPSKDIKSTFKFNTTNGQIQEAINFKPESASEEEKKSIETTIKKCIKMNFKLLPKEALPTIQIIFDWKTKRSQKAIKKSFMFSFCESYKNLLNSPSNNSANTSNLVSYSTQPIDCKKKFLIDDYLNKSEEMKLEDISQKVPKTYWQEIIKLTDKALVLNPFSFEALERQTYALENLKEYNKALETCKKLVDLEPINLESREKYKDLMLLLNFPEEAIEAENKEIEQIKSSKEYKSWFWNKEGFKNGFWGNANNSIRDFSLSIEQNPNNPYPFTNRALAKAYLGELEEAKKDALIANKLFEAQKHIGGIQYTEKLLQDLEREISKKPNTNKTYN